MRIVTLTRDMRPHRSGDDRVLPDDIAAKLVANGEAENSRPFPPPDVAPSGSNTLTLPARRGYLTRKRG